MPESSAATNTKSTIWEKARAETKKVGDWYILTAVPGIPLAEEVKQLKQIHSANIFRATRDKEGGGEGDGWVVEGKDITVSVYTADCAPVSIIGGNKAVILHLSRKSLVRGMLSNALTYFQASEIDWVMIGPHICEWHFKFEEEEPLLKLFRLRYPEAVHFHQGKIMVSLKQAIRSEIESWGVHRDKILNDNRCTYESLELPSHRKWVEAGKPGELGQINTVVWKDPNS